MTKRRISLTLEESLLKRADRLVGHLSESRSGVFEKLLERAFLTTTPKTAVILTGSGDTILKEFGGKRAVDIHLEKLAPVGVKRVVFIGKNAGSLKEKLETELELKFIDDEGSGTGGALREASHLLKDSFFLIYGDTISSIDYLDFYRFHFSQNVMATVALTTWKEPQKFGVPEMRGTRVVGFREKPSRSESYLISAGSFVIEPEVLKVIPKGPASLERHVLPKLASINQLAGYIFSGEWRDLGEAQIDKP